MAHYAFVAQLKTDKVDDYVAAHRNIPPKVVELYHQVGIRLVKMYLHEAQIFMFIEADDLAAAQKVLDESPDDQAWNEAVRPFKAREFQLMSEIFDLSRANQRG